MNILLELTWRGALMTVIIASLDRLCAAKINARVRRVWWLLVPLAFLVTVPVPVLPATTSVVPASVGAHEAAWPVDGATRPAGQVAAVTPSPSITVPWTQVIAMTGSVVYLLVVVGRTCSALRRWSHVPLCTDPALLLALEECKAEAGITTPIGLVVSERISTPLILGWRHPRVLLPGPLVTALSREQLRGVLFHELAHLRSMDVPYTLLFTLVGALHWFNPAAHLALRWWAQFREEAADETAIRWLGRASGVDYGETLLHVLRHTNEQPAAPFLTLSIVESVSQLRKRLTMIKHYEHRSPHLLFTGTIFVAALCILLRPVQAQNAPAQSAAPPAATIEKPASTPSALNPNDSPAMIAEFKKRGYTIPDALVDERINDLVRGTFHGDHAVFVQTLTAQGFTEEKYREVEREKIMAQAMPYQLMKDAQTVKGKVLIIPKIEVNNLPLSDAIQLLALEVSRLVPKGQGMDVRLDPQAPQALRDAKVTLNLHNVSLLDVLLSMAQQTNSEVSFDRQGLGLRAKWTEVTSAAKPSPAQIAHGEDSDAEVARDEAAIEHKLEIVIPHVVFHAEPLSDVLESLRAEARRLDATESNPANRGVNIFLKLPAAVEVPPGSAAPATVPGTRANSRVTLDLGGRSLREVLDAVAGQVGMKVKVEQYAVSLVPLTEETERMITAQLTVAPEVLGAPPADAARPGAPNPRFDPRPWLERKGLTFPTGSSVAYLPASRKLVVRNTPENIERLKVLFPSASPVK